MLTSFADTMRTLSALQRAMDDTFRSNWFGNRTASYGSRPLLNVFEQGENLVVLAEVPGASKGDFDIQVKGNAVRIAGKRQIQHEENASAHRLERPAMDFDRTLTLPFAPDADRIKAEYRDGILAILVTPHEQERPRSISIS